VPCTRRKVKQLITRRLLVEESRMLQIKAEMGGQEKLSAFPAKFQTYLVEKTVVMIKVKRNLLLKIK